MKLLFVSNKEGNAYELFKSMELHNKIKPKFINLKRKPLNKLIKKIFIKLGFPLDEFSFNDSLLKLDLNQYDVIFIVKGITILPNTLSSIKKNKPNIKLVSWSLDDMYARHNNSFYYKKGLKFYDYIFTTKSYNVNELKSFNAKKIIFHYQCCNDYIFNYKKSVKAPNKVDVSFVGFPEKQRFESLKFLAQNGIKVNIYGSVKWKSRKYNFKHPNFIVEPRQLDFNEYIDKIAESKLSICFLRKMNRDLHTTRSVEIPAIGTLMIAEKTIEHSKLFKENEEAIFFKNNLELLKKIKFYLKNEQKRKRIADNGQKRIKELGLSNSSFLNFFYEQIN
tara:strand:+ start:1532 stop:2536 length:1005 start_codon:yes stop_codon:yes gene_type:complete